MSSHGVFDNGTSSNMLAQHQLRCCLGSVNFQRPRTSYERLSPAGVRVLADAAGTEGPSSPFIRRPSPLPAARRSWVSPSAGEVRALSELVHFRPHKTAFKMSCTVSSSALFAVDHLRRSASRFSGLVGGVMTRSKAIVLRRAASSTRETCIAVHCPPRRVTSPSSFRCFAIACREAPAVAMSRTIGAMSRYAASAFDRRTAAAAASPLRVPSGVRLSGLPSFFPRNLAAASAAFVRSEIRAPLPRRPRPGYGP